MPYLLRHEVDKHPLEFAPPSIAQSSIEVVKQMDDALMYGFKETFKHLIPLKINELISSVLAGGIGILVSANEGYEGFDDAKDAYRDEHAPQRKTRIATGAFIAALGGAGIGISAASLADYFGATVAGGEFLSPVFSGTLLLIYLLAVERQSYILLRAMEEEEKAKQCYINALAALQAIQDELARLQEKQDSLNLATTSSSASSSPAELIIARQEYIDATLRIQELQPQYDEKLGILNAAKENYQEMHNKRLEAERKLTYSTFELVACALIFTSTVLAAVAGGAATFGVVPLVLLIAGIAFGLSTKIFEKVDERKGNKMSTAIRNWFVDGLAPYFTSKPKEKIHVEPISCKTSNSTCPIPIKSDSKLHASISEIGKPQTSDMPQLRTSPEPVANPKPLVITTNPKPIDDLQFTIDDLLPRNLEEKSKETINSEAVKSARPNAIKQQSLGRIGIFKPAPPAIDSGLERNMPQIISPVPG